MLLTVETVVRPDEVVPVPPLEVVLGPPELHQWLSHGGGEPEPRAPEECETNTNSVLHKNRGRKFSVVG
jgi:hypothetical protein